MRRTRLRLLDQEKAQEDSSLMLQTKMGSKCLADMQKMVQLEQL